jgi:hypothetical protein
VQTDELVDAAQRHARYIARAQEAAHMASSCHEPEARLTWLEIAASWRNLAQHTAQHFKL